MVDLSITASEVIPGTGAVLKTATASVAITAGQAVYIVEANGQAALADKNTSATTAQAKGIAVNNAAAGQPVKYQTAGTIDLGATAAAASGVVYVLSDSGGISPAADIASSDYAVVLGVGKGSDEVGIGITVGGQLA